MYLYRASDQYGQVTHVLVEQKLAPRLLARHWRFPPGTVCTLFTVVGILANALSGFCRPALILVAAR